MSIKKDLTCANIKIQTYQKEGHYEIYARIIIPLLYRRQK